MEKGRRTLRWSLRLTGCSARLNLEAIGVCSHFCRVVIKWREARFRGLILPARLKRSMLACRSGTRIDAGPPGSGSKAIY